MNSWDDDDMPRKEREKARRAGCWFAVGYFVTLVACSYFLIGCAPSAERTECERHSPPWHTAECPR